MGNTLCTESKAKGKTRSRAWPLTSVLAIVALLTACSSIDGALSVVGPTAEPSSTERSQDQREALLAYVEAERATIPVILESMPGVYSSVTVKGTFEEVKDNPDFPDGIHAVVWFDYTYVPNYDLSVAYRQIEASEAEMDQWCETKLFPAMREFGVDPPLGVTFTYHAAQETMAPLTSLWCSTSG